MAAHTGLTGLDLKLRRVGAQLTVKAVAEAMGVHHSRVSRIEREPRVTVDMERRYMKALVTSVSSRTSGKAA